MSISKKRIFKRVPIALPISALMLLPISNVQAELSYEDVGELIWEDNFDTLNTNYWTTDDGNGCDIGLCGWGNEELQSYASDNVFIEAIDDTNNALVLQARQETYDDRNFTSGKINSEDKVTVQYGLIEMRIKVPDLDQGLWPAAWMLGANTLSWPAKGEIDMMEMGHSSASREAWLSYNNDASDDNGEAPDINNYTGANMIFYSEDACSDGNATCAASMAWQNDNAYVSETPMNDRFVIYRTYWTDSEMRFTVVDNGVEYDMYNSSFTLGDDLSAFKAPYYLLMNLAVGGNFTDASTDSEVSAPIPASMYIDYIRVYELDGQGSVTIGDQSVAETGTFGVFTDNTATSNKLEAGSSSEIYLWDSSSSAGSEAAYEGDNVISWNVNSANVWFGSGVQSLQALDMSNYEEGELTFNIKIPADIDFRIGITDTYGNENWLTFPANETSYGLQRDGEWGEVTIPVSDIRGTLIALQSLQYPFAISSDPNNLPSTTFSYAIDNIVWTGGGEAADSDSDNDGVIDSIDLCADTPENTQVDNDGCALSSDPQIGNIEITQADADSWTSVSFAETFANTPIVTLGALSFNGSDPASTRIRNITSSGFEVQLDEWDYRDGAHAQETLSYIALDQGSVDWAGVSVLADSITAVDTSWQSITFATAFTDTPIIMPQQVSNNDSAATTIRIRNVSETGFEIKLQEEEASDNSHSSETIHYLAISTGTGEINGQSLVVGNTGSSINSSWTEVDFSTPLTDSAFLADMQSFNGSDTATVRYRNLSESSVELKIHEEQSNDSEQWHKTESIGWILIGDPVLNEVVDADNDGVDDSIDACLDTSSGDIVDSTGCTITPSLISGNGNGSISAVGSTEMQAANLAFDGNMVTRWESTHAIDPSTLTLDLGSEYQLSQVIIYWEAANAETYTIEGSTDNVTWTTLASYEDGEFGNRTDTLSLNGSYRYIRMNGTSRSSGNLWGYSIYEMEVYGVTNSSDDSDGSTDDGNTDDGNTDDGNTDEGNTDDGNTDDGNTDEGNTDDGNTDDGNTDEGNTDDGNTDDGNTDDGNTEDGNTDDGDSENTASIIPLFDSSTELEQEISFDRGDALVTRFADRGRDRHAREDQFQAYDHYLSHYWTHRTAQVQFEDYAAKGGDHIDITFITEWKLGATEFRAWYRGVNTVAEYHGNLGGSVVEVDSGTYDHDFNRISSDGDQYRYTLTISQYRSLDGDYADLEVGQGMEFEISQFLDGAPEGRDNYYGTTYLYVIGKGLVPWETQGSFEDQSSLRENSYEIAESAWLGGNTTLPYNYTNETENHFMQMATNLSNVNGQAFVLGRRIHHTDFIDGSHDESADNGIFDEMVGLAGSHYVNSSCAGCHERNGRAAPAEIGESLDKWVFKVAQSNGDADPNLGFVLQPNNTGIDDSEDGEGTVSISAWTEVDGLRTPNYSFSRYTPDLFSARIAPQLVGLGLLEAISESDILALEDVNDSDGDGISGRAQRITDPVTGETRLGRFGWKAGKTSLTHQVAGAFNTDMGVMTSVFPTPDCGSDQEECGDEGAEVSDEDLENLVKYVALLGVRAQRDINDSDVIAGEAIFSEIGCDSCHTPTLTTSEYHPYAELRNQTIHPYTDLLVHDMGEGLADNLGEGDASGSEWRTTPLWGLGLSACVTGGTTNTTGAQGDNECVEVHSYLHDGRARTIDEAILWHGGEGQASNTAYQNLSDSDKAALLSFLNSL